MSEACLFLKEESQVEAERGEALPISATVGVLGRCPVPSASAWEAGRGREQQEWNFIVFLKGVCMNKVLEESSVEFE